MINYVSIGDILNKTFSSVKNTGREIQFLGDESFMLYHEQDCCESVYVEDVCGDLSDLEGTPILSASSDTNSGTNDYDGDCQWTFYHFRTIKGTVTIRFYGTSNGYYSTGVSFVKI